MMRDDAAACCCKYGFIGVGNMASALIAGLIDTGAVKPDNIMVFDIDASRCTPFTARGAYAAESAAEVCGSCAYIYLAVKPYQMRDCLAGIKDARFFDEAILVSIAASVPTDFIASQLGREAGVIRVMPSTPMLVGKGASAVTANRFVPAARLDEFVADLKKVSVVEVMDESLLNPVISVNGSSPAYCYLFIKALLEGAVAQGIKPEIAQPLLLQTIEGAVEMVRRAGKPIDVLIREVSSPGGTTLAALDSFEKSGFVQSVVDAMRACTTRADEITTEL